MIGLPGRVRRVQDSLDPPEWRRVGGMLATVIGLTVSGFLMLFAAIPHHYHLNRTELFGLGTGILAYTLGMRHAFDADHISAIDNTTRKLMAEGKRPLSVGFWFSLGPLVSVVFALAVLLNFGIRFLDRQVQQRPAPALHHWTNIIGTSVSGAFLYLIAVLNIVILVSITKVFLQHPPWSCTTTRRSSSSSTSGGLMNRFFGSMARRIDKPWKMYPVGLLFGLGSTPPPRWPCWSCRDCGGQRACPSGPSSRCRSSSPPDEPTTAAERRFRYRGRGRMKSVRCRRRRRCHARRRRHRLAGPDRHGPVDLLADQAHGPVGVDRLGTCRAATPST